MSYSRIVQRLGLSKGGSHLREGFRQSPGRKTFYREKQGTRDSCPQSLQESLEWKLNKSEPHPLSPFSTKPQAAFSSSISTSRVKIGSFWFLMTQVLSILIPVPVPSSSWVSVVLIYVPFHCISLASRWRLRWYKIIYCEDVLQCRSTRGCSWRWHWAVEFFEDDGWHLRVLSLILSTASEVRVSLWHLHTYYLKVFRYFRFPAAAGVSNVGYQNKVLMWTYLLWNCSSVKVVSIEYPIIE